MRGLKTWLLYGLLLALAGAAALAGRSGTPSDSPVPSIENPGPRGARALYLYLLESGRRPLALEDPLTELPGDLAALVIAAPAERTIDPDEVAAIERFVRGGGTLVYLAPRPHQDQRRMSKWLELSAGPAARADALEGEWGDPGGASSLALAKTGALAGVGRLRITAASSVVVDDPSSVPVASGGALWWKRLGEGEIWIGSGPDLVQSDRIELLDNAVFWENLAALGRIGFDEHHHRSEPPPPISNGLLAFGLQFLACFAFFAYARGSRLGPPRAELLERHRSTREYLDSLAHLTRRAKVERELVPELAHRLRVLMQDRLGIALSLSEADAAQEVERRCQVPSAKLTSLLARARTEAPAAGPREFARIAREIAQLERVITGRAGAHARLG
ncbi:MAG: DUF4350 domain-containing protein [Myxococcales bacterium]|nr:DUF4350 domain-containing protein [Myxococcales bacterium]